MCVKEVLALRRKARNPEIAEAFNRQLPHEMPVEILHVSHICNFDQSPQSVEPVANTTLARKGTGERVVKTRGKEKDRVTAQFRASLDGTKCPSMLIFKGAAAADEVVPCGKRTT